MRTAIVDDEVVWRIRMEFFFRTRYGIDVVDKGKRARFKISNYFLG